MSRLVRWIPVKELSAEEYPHGNPLLSRDQGQPSLIAQPLKQLEAVRLPKGLNPLTVQLLKQLEAVRLPKSQNLIKARRIIQEADRAHRDQVAARTQNLRVPRVGAAV